VRRLASATVLAVVVMSLSVRAWAQFVPIETVPEAPGFFLIPSFRVAEEFDDNIFGSSRDKQSDFISRFSPGLEMGYRSEPFTLLVNGGFDAEVFAKNSDQNDEAAGKRGGLSLRYLPIRSLTLSFNVAYSETRSVTTLASSLAGPTLTSVPVTPTPAPTATPGAPPGTTPAAGGTGAPPAAPAAPVAASAFEFGRSKATILTVAPAAVYQFTARTTGSAGYTFTRGTLEGGVSNTAHQVPLSLSHQFTMVDTGRIGYRLDVFESPGSPTEITHTGTVGYTRQLTPALVLALDAGPRFTDQGVSPEVSARLDYKFRLLETLGSAFLSYTRSEGFVLGQAGTVKTETFSGGVVAQPLRVLQVSLLPALTRYSGGTSENSTLDTTIYGVVVGASYQMLRWLAARASYSFSHQDQSGARGLTITRNVVSLSLEASYPYRIGQ
jgi:hypothetical protein